MTQIITEDTPIAMLTVGQLRKVLNNTPSKLHSQEDCKRYIYGLRGIRELFNVCQATAHKYKASFLKPAIIQNGRKIMIDADKALRLFAEYQREMEVESE